MGSVQAGWLLLVLGLQGCDPKEPVDSDPGVVESAPPAETGHSDPPVDTEPPPDTASPDADGDGWTVAAGDCDDGDATVHPEAEEACNEVDDDCDDEVDEGTVEEERFGGWPMADIGSIPYLSEEVFADLDGDGLLDHAYCRDYLSLGINPGTPWVVDGESALNRELIADLDDFCADLDAADLDGDGDQDLIIRFYYDHDLVVWLNDGLGGLVAGESFGQGSHQGGELAVGDFDGDGFADIASEPEVFWSDGAGGFEGDLMPCSSSSYRLHALPLLTDGRSVLICGSDEGWVSGPSRGWARVEIDGGCGSQTIGLGPGRVADLDGDGHVDTIAGWNEAKLCLGDGRGNLADAGLIFETPEFLYSDAWVTNLADANGDGWADVALRLETNGEVDDVILLDGASGLVEVQRVSMADGGGDGGGALWQDLDGDGVTDLVTWSEGWSWHPSDGEGGFIGAWMASPSASVGRGGAVDLNGDGLGDPVGTRSDQGFVWLADGTRDMHGYASFSLDSRRDGWAFWSPGPDLDADGDEELLLNEPNNFSLIVVVDLDTASGEPEVSEPLSGPEIVHGPAYPHCGDLDGDGDDELIVENIGLGNHTDEDPHHLWIGGLGEAGYPSSWLPVADTVGDGPFLGKPILLDLGSDGREELILLREDSVVTHAWNGKSFEEMVRSEGLWSTDLFDLGERYPLSAHDMDGDGHQDLVLLYELEQLLVMIGDGAGGFGEAIQMPIGWEGEGFAGFVMTDLLGDGRLDIVGQGSSGLDGRYELRVLTLTDGGQIEESELHTSALRTAMSYRDVDGDGMEDLVGAGNGRAVVHWGETETVEEPLCE